jgi:hypothetical protein
MNFYLRRTIFLLFSAAVTFSLHSQVTNVYTGATTWTVPAGITSITIKVYGGAGGIGGEDCGAGCSNTAAGPVGFILADFNVTPGDVIGIYPGGKGGDGINNASGSGGGAGGAATYNTSYNGGNGGNAGTSGSSGGGGGGGGASVITINSTIMIVAGGAGGGGGMANQVNSGQNGSSTVSANGTSNAGGNGTTPGGDGGGGGGGGGGQFGSLGGGVHAAGSESAGNGGFLGGNSVTGASAVTTNGNVAWTTTGQIEIAHLHLLPVGWLSFTASKQGNDVLLRWGTASEQNTEDYEIQRSADGSKWNNIGTVTAAGNSSTVRQYNYTDQQPAHGINYYRLLQRDLDNNIAYSDVISLSFSASANTLKIFPNPVINGTVTVSLNEASVISIYNSVGIKLRENVFSAGNHPIGLSQFAKGIYLVKANNDAALLVIQ